FETTFLIIALWFSFAIVLANILFFIRSMRSRAPQPQVVFKTWFVLPTLILGPVALVAFFSLFSINLIFPVHLLAGVGALFLAALVPALILLLASGMVQSLCRSIAFEYEFWRQKPFARLRV